MAKKPMSIGGHEVKGTSEITMEIIWNDMKSRTEADKRWFRQLITEEVKKPSGKMAVRTFIEVKKEFLKKYYPEYAPKEKEQGMTIADVLAELNKELGE